MKRSPLKRRTPLHWRKKLLPAWARRRFDRLSRIGCIVCRDYYGYYAEPEIHHIREGYGAGQKAPHEETIPLCWIHHSADSGDGFHASPKNFRKHYGSERALLKRVNELLEAA